MKSFLYLLIIFTSLGCEVMPLIYDDYETDSLRTVEYSGEVLTNELSWSLWEVSEIPGTKYSGYYLIFDENSIDNSKGNLTLIYRFSWKDHYYIKNENFKIDGNTLIVGAGFAGKKSFQIVDDELIVTIISGEEESTLVLNKKDSVTLSVMFENEVFAD